MKPALLILSFLLFAFTTKLPLAFSEAAEQVVDINGNPIFPGGQYFVRPAIRGPPGGGVKLGKTGGSKCPVTVLQDYLAINNGLPVKFSIPGISPGIIFTGTPLDIEFTAKPICAESSKWIVFVDNDIQKACVGIGGPEDHPGKQTLSGKFQIERYRNIIDTYKLVFCVSGSPTCSDIGRYDNQEHGRRLILTEDEAAFEIVFIEAAAPPGIRSVV